MVTYGFYDSLNHDRRYNSIQFGSIFDGIIRDGIFMSIGTCFKVIPGEDMMLLVGIGRAWFDHTWTLNDAPLPIHIPQSELLLDRIDAVVIDVNSGQEARKNDIIVVKGTPSKTPQRPTLINVTNHHQYPLAYISVKAGVEEIRAADITSMVGMETTPYVTGILETVGIDALIDQWKDQWDLWYDNQTNEGETQWDEWYNKQTGLMTSTNQYWINLWNQWFYSYTNRSQNGLDDWIDRTENDFITWWESIRSTLTESCCANLAAKMTDLENEILELRGFESSLVEKRELYPVIYDTQHLENIVALTNDQNIDITNEEGEIIDLVTYSAKSEPILDHAMDPIKGTLKVVIL